MALTVGTNTYVSAAAAETYCDMAGLPTLSDSEGSLKRATMALDRLYGGRFIGTKETLEQPLMWPRRPTGAQVDSSQDWYVVDSFGNYRNFTGIPVEVEQATTELAVMLEAGVDLYAQEEPSVTERSVTIDVISESVKFSGGGYKSTALHKINVILAPLLAVQGQIRLVR